MTAEIKGGVLNYKRTESHNDEGYVGIAQELSEPVFVTRVEVKAKIISHSLRNPGWWSCVHGGYFEYPIHIYLWSRGKGKEVVWNWGFLTEDDNGAGCKAPSYTLVPPNEWFRYDSGPFEHPLRVTKVVIQGDGWDFEAGVDYIKLTCIKPAG